MTQQASFWRLARILLALTCAAAGPARATEARFWLASQHDFGAKRGFYLDFENSAHGDEPCELQSLRIIVGAADGKQWRFAGATPKWQYNHEYRVHAVVGPKRVSLSLDGSVIAQAEGGFEPDASSLSAALVPSWADGRTEYLIRQTSLRIWSLTGRRLEKTFQPGSGAPLALTLFAPAPGATMAWSSASGDMLTIEATFEVIPYPSLRRLAPFVDRYGQSRHATWPDKIGSDADLRATVADERARLRTMPNSPDFDRYGGYLRAGWHDRGTGFFRVETHGGKWWLVTPDGNPCFYTGVGSAPALSWETTPVTGREYLFEWLPPHDGPYAAAWKRNAWGAPESTDYVAFHTANLIRKYGTGWEETARAAARMRLKAWGFGGGGKWDAVDGLPCAPVLGRGDVPNVARHPDVFDPAVCARFREVLGRQIRPRRTDPLVIGWSLGNEYDEIVNKAEVRDILSKPAGVPAKRALIDHALATIAGDDAAKLGQSWHTAAMTRDLLYAATDLRPSDADVEVMRLFYAERYYKLVYDIVKSEDPNHLYLGFWIVPSWWENEQDWIVSARYCDVVGYDRYAPEFADALLKRLERASRKPILCGEFSFPPRYDGTRGFGTYPTSAKDEAETARLYTRWVADAASDPYCVGTMWFQYRDQPLTGRGPGHGPDLVYGEHYAFGLVDVTDRPKWDLVAKMRRANLGAALIRLSGTSTLGKGL